MITLEGTYSLVYCNIISTVTTLSKGGAKTESVVRKIINNRFLHILRNDGYFDVYNFMSTYIDTINDGVVWADQDLKSSNHFYSPKTKRGLYGNSNAKNECDSYYNSALTEFVLGDM